MQIPISEAKPLLEDLIQYGYVKGRVMLGITGRTTSYGFQILSFNEDSVFNGTRAQRGDVITHIDGVEVKDHAAIGTGACQAQRGGSDFHHPAAV